jgi:hypothetical protein
MSGAARTAGGLALCLASFAAGLYLAHANEDVDRWLNALDRVIAPRAGMYNEHNQLVRFPKREVACPPQTPRTMVAVLIGQSNAANTGGHRFRGKPGVVNFFDGKCFEAVDPLLGAADKQGNVATLAANLVADRYDAVVLVPLAVGGSTIAEWNGRLAGMLDAGLAELKQRYTATHVLWHQGESDAHGTSPAQYASGLSSLIAATRRHFPESGFYVSAATYCESRGGADAALHDAQLRAVDPAHRVYAGPDTDRFVALEDRYDGCHLSMIGQEKVAREWARALR